MPRPVNPARNKRVRIQRLRVLVARGLSDTEIAARYRVSRQAIVQMRARYGIPSSRPAGGQTVDRVGEHRLKVLGIDLPVEKRAKPATKKAWRAALAGAAYADARTRQFIAQRGDGPATSLRIEARS